VIHAARNEFHLIELKGTQTASVTPKATYFHPVFEIPYPGSAVIRTRDEDRKGKVGKGFTKLEAHDAVGVTL
jgi:hypothetical protein